MRKPTVLKNFILLSVSLILIAASFLMVTIQPGMNDGSQTSIPVFNRIRSIVNSVMDAVQKNFTSIGNYDVFRGLVLPELTQRSLELQIADLTGRLLFDSTQPADAFTDRMLNLPRVVHYDLAFAADRPGFASFAFPVMIDGVQQANALFVIPAGSINLRTGSGELKQIILPACMLLLALVLILKAFHTIYRSYILPVKRLSETVPQMIRGNLDISLHSFEQTEMGEFIRGLDLMRVELKDMMERKNKLESERKALVASISHDIKTPLASVKAYAEGLRDGIASDAESIHRYAAVILTKTDGLIKLVNDLMQHSLQEVGSLSISLQEYYSGNLLRKILEPIQLKLSSSAHSLEIRGELPDVLIKADAMRVEQVLANLIQNAEKYSPDGVSIVVEAVIEDECLLVSVSDNGGGIPPKELPFIFDRYYRGDKARQSSIEGSGLGLSICKYIIERHGGVIFAESTKGQGSIFRFTIPKV